ncbi:GNAT family N-acetyltransferase [Pelagibacteraceae bacterium]|nr:GNAT family N-acetyltransferase [Pelagibacteraceae bacterium]
MDFEIKIYSKLNAELQKHWQNFELQSNSYCFQTYDWFENWMNIFRSNNKKYSLCVVVVFAESKVLSICPFEIESRFNLKILKWAGGDQADYYAPALSKNFDIDEKEFFSLWKKIIQTTPKVDVIYLNRQPKYIESALNPFVSYLKNYYDSNTYNVLLPQTWNDYINLNLKKSFLQQNLRKKKQLKKLGNLKFKIANTKEDKERFLKELLLQKNRRLSSSGIKNLFKNENLEFYREFENRNLKNIKTHICALLLNDEMIAIHWGVIFNMRFYYLVLSMKEENLYRYSPGRLLISLLIRWSIAKKIKIFDFTLGNENYKKSWSNNNNALFNYVKANSLRGFFLYFLITIKLILKTLDRKNYLGKIIFSAKNLRLYVNKFF